MIGEFLRVIVLFDSLTAVEPSHSGLLGHRGSGRSNELAVMGRQGCNVKPFLSEGATFLFFEICLFYLINCT